MIQRIKASPIVNGSDMLHSQSLDPEDDVLQHTGQWVLESDFDFQLFAHHSVTYRLRERITHNCINTEGQYHQLSSGVTQTHRDDEVRCAQSEVELFGQSLFGLSDPPREREHQSRLTLQLVLVVLIGQNPLQRPLYTNKTSH